MKDITCSAEECSDMVYPQQHPNKEPVSDYPHARDGETGGEPATGIPVDEDITEATAENEELLGSEFSEEDRELFIKQLLMSVLDEYFRCFNTRDWDGMRRLVTPNVQYQFLDCNNNLIHEMDWSGYRDMLENNMYSSFPDFKNTHLAEKEEMVLTRSNNSDYVLQPFQIVASGTHTGTPFSAVGPCPPIPASGAYIELDPEDACVTFRDKKICKIEIKGQNDLTGPAGFYTKLGGFPLLGSLPPSLPPPP